MMSSIIKRGRILGQHDDVFSQNAWDDTEWTEEMRQQAKQRIDEQKRELQQQFLDQAARLQAVEQRVADKWNDFYAQHEDKFFKDRHWIFSEFPEILDVLKLESGPSKIFEVGCGVGNAVVHITNCNRNPNFHIYCCDLAHSAIETLRNREFYLKSRHQISAFQADVCKAAIDDSENLPIEHSSLDFIMLIFTLSAMKPDQMQVTLNNLTKFLKPNGMFLVRDYAQYDMTQLRFKGKSFLSDNYYVRSDGTTSYFFTPEKLSELFQKTGCLEQVELTNDNRLLVNRLKALKMCRCWIQAKYRKLGA